MVTVDEVVVDENEQIPKVDADSHLVEFFNDNQRFAAMHKSELRSFLNPRNDKINARYSGHWVDEINAAVLECREYIKNKGLKYKPLPKSKSSAATPGRKLAPKREPRSEHSDNDTDEPKEEQRRSKKRRQTDSADGTQEKMKDAEDTESSARKRKKRKNADAGEDALPKTSKKIRNIKDEAKPLQVLPPPNRTKRGKNLKSEPALEDEHATDKNAADGKRKETKGRREVKSKKMTAKREKDENKKTSDERIVKEESLVITAEQDARKRGVKTGSTEVKAAVDKERSGSEKRSRSREDASKEGGEVADSHPEPGDDKAGEEKSKRDEASKSPVPTKLDKESLEVDDVYGTLSRPQLVEIVNMLEKQARTYRMELRQLYMGIGRTRDFVDTRGDFLNLIAPGFGLVAQMIAVCTAKTGVNMDEKEKIEADAIEKLDRILRAHVSREVLKHDLRRVSKRAMKLATKVMEHSVKVARVMREIVVQWIDVAVIESVSSAGDGEESQMVVNGQDQGKKRPADDEEKRDVGDSLGGGREKEDSGEREPEKLKESSMDMNEAERAQNGLTTDADVREGDKADADMVDVEGQGAQREKEEEEQSNVGEEGRGEQDGEKEQKGSMREEVGSGARKEGEINDGSKKQEEVNGSSKKQEEVNSEARKEGEIKNGTNKKEEENGERKKGEGCRESRKEGDVSGGERKEGEVKDKEDENRVDKARKVSPSERHERRVREFTRERCLDTFKKVLNPLKGSEVKEVVVDDEKLEELAEALERAVEPTRKEDMHRYFETSRKVLKMLTGSSQSRNEVLKCVIAKNNIKTFVGRCLNNEFVKGKETNAS